jgi:hypothetical protein
MTTPEGRAMTPAALKKTIEAADRAVARGAPGEALRLLLGTAPEGERDREPDKALDNSIDDLWQVRCTTPPAVGASRRSCRLSHLCV